jgi:hypothetical protein
VDVAEYRSDGSIVTVTTYLSEEDVNELSSVLLSTERRDETLKLLQEYGLIPGDVTEGDIQKGMMQRAISMDLSPDIMHSDVIAPILKQRLPIMIDFFSKISTVHIGGASVRLGLSPIIGYLNFIRGWNIPKLDALDMAWGLVGVVDSWGVLTHHSLVTFPGCMGLFGFVGYNVKLPIAVHTFYGYAGMTFAMGLGLHSVIFFYWLNSLQ